MEERTKHNEIQPQCPPLTDTIFTESVPLIGEETVSLPPLTSEALAEDAKLPAGARGGGTGRISLAKDRVARLRRIVRDGEEINRRIERLREDLHQELPEVYHQQISGVARVADILGDIDRAFDRAAFFARGQAEVARRRLEEEDLPISFPRRQKETRDVTQSLAEESLPRLWDSFITADERAEEES